MLKSAKSYIKQKLGIRPSFLSLPAEIRIEIYERVCTPQPDGNVKGVLNILLLNKDIFNEAHPVFDRIEHVIRIGDTERPEEHSVEYLGTPYLIMTDKLDWHLAGLKDLAFEIRLLGLGMMTPDCFDVSISHNGKQQWRNFKRLVGIWPEIREQPLRNIRLDLAVSQCPPTQKRYRADLIRIIRNFKRTKIWAETGDCSIAKNNKSLLLPVVKAFNQARRHWVEESTPVNNLIIKYDTHILKNRSALTEQAKEDARDAFEEAKKTWSVVVVQDTSRTDNSVWPEWTGKESVYILEKMVKREKDELDVDIQCRECLAMFCRPKEMRAHIGRGQLRQAVVAEKIAGEPSS